MTKEEKAKAYDEAIERAKTLYNSVFINNDILEQIFPELAESEDSEDERIRKDLVNFLWAVANGTVKSMPAAIMCQEWIAWLEKQSKEDEHKEPSFFTHHEIGESLQEAVTHQMEDDGDVDDFVRKGIDNIVLKYAVLGVGWQKEQKPVEWSEEDERTRKDLIKYLESDRDCQPCQDVSFYDSSIAWLEKQKECGEANFREGYLHGFEDAQKKQKPSINIDQLKSMMLQYLQEAANEKDDSDIEADTDKWARTILRYDFEQKPVDDKAFEEWIDVWYNEHHRDGYITMDEREFKNFCRGIRNMYQQKPAECEWPNLSNCIRNCKKCHGKCLYRKEPYEEKQPAEVDEYKIIKKHITEDSLSSEVNKRLTECGWYVTDEKPEEWSEEDEKMRKSIIQVLKSFVSQADCESYPALSTSYPTYFKEIDWLKSLRPQSKNEWSEKNMPKWKKVTDYTKLPTDAIVRYESDKNLQIENAISEQDVSRILGFRKPIAYYLTPDDLNKLPKED